MNLRLLWVATKPPWPASDGGRLVQLLTLEALCGAGVAATLVAPMSSGGLTAEAAAEEVRARLPGVDVHLVPMRRRGPLRGLSAMVRRRLPLAIARHVHPAVARRVGGLLDGVDVVHVEQLQALPNAQPALDRGVPVVLRQQNVESDLWLGAARLARPPLDRLLALEGRRLARWERQAAGRVATVVTLTRADAECLGRGTDGRIQPVAAPFPPLLPAAGGTLAGSPPVVLLGSGGWLPNRDSRRWTLEEVWPAVLRRTPAARLHVFGGGAPRRPPPAGVELHVPPADSAQLFSPGCILVVPLRIASGVRMKILEAWARGVPVVATPEAANGLEAEPGRELLVAADAEAFADAVARLAADPALAAGLVAAGRRALAARHAPDRVAARLVAIYRSLATV